MVTLADSVPFVGHLIDCIGQSHRQNHKALADFHAARVLFVNIVSHKEFVMKTTAFILTLSSTLLLGGCYTQFATTIGTDVPEEVIGITVPVIVQPIVPIVIVDPIIYLPPPPYYPLPIGASAVPSATSRKPAESVSRDFGNHRGDSGSARSSSVGRTGGPRR